jgi:hypothetical protein
MGAWPIIVAGASPFLASFSVMFVGGRIMIRHDMPTSGKLLFLLPLLNLFWFLALLLFGTSAVPFDPRSLIDFGSFSLVLALIILVRCFVKRVERTAVVVAIFFCLLLGLFLSLFYSVDKI